ncbi:MAG: A/G-specific adenine glycosylase [Bacteroidales bacterium]|nr:A/G-specific adenine glycosylase [Bacteroidales bacterium]
MQFTDILLHWYAENKRSLPWRGERDVYKVWVSEIILQQTRISQGWEYYLRFIEKFPDLKALAEADEEEVLRVWQGLGYYSRARNMHAAARSVMTEFGGTFPRDYDQVRQLKGVGDYTAAAICSFAYGLPYPAVDGNVLRIICRVYGIHNNIMENRTKKEVTGLCQQLMSGTNPADFNQALMDFGSLQCVPKHPDCENCPCQSECYAFQHEEVELLPVSIKNIRIKNRYFHFFVCVQQDTLMIEKREANDIWKNLYQLPMVETKKNKTLKYRLLYQTKHQLTHQTIQASFYEVPDPAQLPDSPSQRQMVDLKRLAGFAFPKLIVNFFEFFLGSRN